MSILIKERAANAARVTGFWSTILIASAVLAACGGGGGGDKSNPPPTGGQQTPPPPPANVAPVASAGSDSSIELPTDSADLKGSATDDGLPTGSAITYKWTVMSGPSGPGGSPGVVFANDSAATTSARFAGGVGDYTLNLAASDSALTGNSTVHISVKTNPNNYPAAAWTTATPADEKLDVTKLDAARDYSLAAGGTTDSEAGYVIRHGHLVYSWGTATQLFEMKSTTKSMGGLALLLALDEGKLALTDNVSAKTPFLGTDPSVNVSAPQGGGALTDITVLQLATHTAGLSKSDNPNVQARTLLYKPGTTWSYSDQGLNDLADVLTQTYAQDLSTLMFSRVYTAIGITAGDLNWRTNQFRTPTLMVNGSAVQRRELGSGIVTNVNAMARVGLLMLRRGVWADQMLISNATVDKVHTPPAENANLTLADPTNFPGATTNYGILWWTNATGQMAGVPKDAYWAWGLHETFIIVIPSLDLVIARAGDHAWHPGVDDWNGDFHVLEPFLTPIAQAVQP